jgi:hypothetical protein
MGGDNGRLDHRPSVPVNSAQFVGEQLTLFDVHH